MTGIQCLESLFWRTDLTHKRAKCGTKYSNCMSGSKRGTQTNPQVFERECMALPGYYTEQPSLPLSQLWAPPLLLVLQECLSLSGEHPFFFPDCVVELYLLLLGSSFSSLNANHPLTPLPSYTLQRLLPQGCTCSSHVHSPHWTLSELRAKPLIIFGCSVSNFLIGSKIAAESISLPKIRNVLLR